MKIMEDRWKHSQVSINLDDEEVQGGGLLSQIRYRTRLWDS